METTSLGLAGLFVIEPDRSSDGHSTYSYYYSEKGLAQAGAQSHFVQEHASLVDPALGLAWPCGQQPGFIFPADCEWPALAALDTPFHH